MSRRPVPRRLDPWAALLLGVAVTLGVIILLATPGPWHKVVPAVASRPPLAPPPPPRDIAVFLKGPGHEGFAGALWLHIDYEQSDFTVVVVPVRLACDLPSAGQLPLGEIVDKAGPRVAAKALGDRLAVAFSSWITLDPLAVRAALPGFVTSKTSSLHRPELPLTGVWALDQAPLVALQRQMRYLQFALKGGLSDEINLVGLVNYVLGSNDVSTALRLQAASAIGAALDAAGPGNVVTSSLPAIVHRRGSYERWTVSQAALLALRQSLAFDAAAPIYQPALVVRPAGRAVVVVTSPLGRFTAAYRTAFTRALRAYGAGAATVELRAATTPTAAVRALARPGGGTPLGVVVALGRSAKGAVPSKRTAALVSAALGTVLASEVPAVVSEVPATPAAINKVIDTQAKRAGLPLSPVAAALAAPGPSASPTVGASPTASASPTPGATTAAGSTPTPGAAAASPTPTAGATAGPAAAATATAATSPRPTPAASSSTATSEGGGAPLTPALVRAWARLDAATFVRAVQPAFFAPRLAATGLGVTFYDRTRTQVVVAGSPPAAARLAANLDVFGYAARTEAAGLPAAALLPVIYYQPGDRWLARALAGDLGLPASQVRAAVRSSAALTVVLPT